MTTPANENAWFLKARIPDSQWEQAAQTDFPARGHKTRLKYVVLEHYADAYDVSMDEAAESLRAILAANVKTGWVHQYNDDFWFLMALDDQGVQHKFLVDAQGTLTYYSPPSWEERMGIPVPVGDTVSVEDFRGIDPNAVVATKNTLKRTYGRLYSELSGTNSLAKLRHLRNTLRDVLDNPANLILLNEGNPDAYLVVEPAREVVWVVRNDGRYVFRIFSKESSPSIYQSILG